MNFNGEERQFNVLGLSFKARQWGNSDGIPVLALHGWLDNSASFDRLAPLLENVNLVALDMAGHGLSSHRSADSSYNIWEDVIEIVAIANQLEWDQFSLIGHSRGAIISVLSAGTLPQRIVNLVLLDGFFPSFTATEDVPAQLGKAIDEHLQYRPHQPRCHADLKQAIQSRAMGDMAINYAEAELLASRGVSQRDDGYFWHSDRRLYLPSPMRLSREQFMAFVNAIQCPGLLCLARNGIGSLYPEFQQAVDNHLPKGGWLQTITLAGRHHLHMEEDTVPAVAEAINRFLQAKNQ